MPNTIITMELSFDTERLPLAIECFLKAQPMPKDGEGNDLYTFTEHLIKYAARIIKGEIEEGKRKIDAKSANLEGIIE